MATKNRFAVEAVWLLYVEREIVKRHDAILDGHDVPFFTMDPEKPLVAYGDLSLTTRVCSRATMASERSAKLT